MIDLEEWLLERIRRDSNDLALHSGWLEIDRYKLNRSLNTTINFMIQGGTLLLCHDGRFEWFASYVASKINSKNRPLVPIYSLKDVVPNLDFTLSLESGHGIVNDLLKFSYKDYAFWYIGRLGTPIANLALGKEKGFPWILDDEVDGAFSLSSIDKILDYKILQLYRIFESALFGVMLGDIALD